MEDKLKMIPNYIYFYHLDEFCVLPLYPETITDQMSSKFAETNALSRSAPVFSYINSGPRSVNISLKLHRDLMNDLNRDVSNIKANVVDFSKGDYIDTLIKYLQAISLPRYKNYSTGSKSVIPPMVAIRFGNDIFIKGVVDSGVTVTYSKPIMVDNKYAQAEISFSIKEVDPYDADYVAGKYDNGEGGSFRGLFDSRFKGGIYKVNNASISNSSSSASGSNGKKKKGTNSTKTTNNTTTHSIVPVHYDRYDDGSNKVPQKKVNITIPFADKVVNGQLR